MQDKNLEQVSWNLDDIVSLSKWPKLYDQTKKQIEELEKVFESTADPKMTVDEFKEIIDRMNALAENMHRLGYRAELMESTNLKNSEAIKLKALANDLDIYSSEKLRKISSWLNGKDIAGKPKLDNTNAKRLFSSAGDMEYLLTYSRNLADHTLDPDSENIILAKSTNGVFVVNELREMITTEFKFHFKLPGQKKEIIETHAQINALTDSDDSQVRAEAYRARMAEYNKNIEKLFIAYQAIVKDWAYTSKLRKYASPISMRNATNGVSDRAIEVLMQVCEQNTGIFQRFFKYKAKQLNLTKLTRFDIYAHIGEDKQKTTYTEAVKLVLGVFEEFSKDFANKAKQIVESQHIDSHPYSDKRDGAFCATITPEIAPYVLLNYAEKSRDISTIAHELGHGVHSLYAQNHSINAQHAPLPLAETASTFGEMILFEKLISTTQDVQQKKYLLASKIVDSYASIIRQNFIVKFEIQAHQMFTKGTTEKEISQAWLDTLDQQFGNNVEVDDMFRHEWAYIPHIHHTPFYCYAYNFGELLSLSLYKQYKEESSSFLPKLERILSAGGSADPAKLLAEIGIDIEDAQFWQSSFDIIRLWQDQLESL